MWGTVRMMMVLAGIALMVAAPALTNAQDESADDTAARAKQAYETARKLQLEGRLPEAEAAFTACLKLDPDYRDALLYRGVIRYPLNYPMGALSDLTRCIELDRGTKRADALIARSLLRETMGDLAGAWQDVCVALQRVQIPEAYALSARIHLADGRTDDAIRDYTRAIELDETHAAAWAGRAQAHLRAGMIDEAVEDSTRAVAVDAESASLWDGHGRVLQQTGRVADAVKAFERATTIDADDPEYRLHLADVRLLLRQYDDAADDYRRVLALREQGPFAVKAWIGRGECLLQLNNLRGASRCAALAVEMDRSDAAAWLLGARVETALDHVDRAMLFLNGAVNAAPDAAAPRIARSRHYADHGYPREAIRDLDHVVALQPANLEALWLRVAIRRNSGSPRGALRDVERILEIAPDDLDARRLQINVLLDLERYDDVVTTTDRLLIDHPDDAEALSQRAWARSNAKEHKDIEGAIADYTRAIELDPIYLGCRLSRSFLYLEVGDPQAALADVNHYIDEMPNDPSGYHYRSMIYEDMGEYEKGLADINRALESRPDDIEALAMACWLCRLAGDFRTALAHGEHAVEVEPEKGRTWTTRAYGHLELGNFAQAFADCRTGSRLSPDDEDVAYDCACVMSLYIRALDNGADPLPAVPTREAAAALVVELMHRSIDLGFDNRKHVSTDPDMKQLRALPGWSAILERLPE